MVHDALPMGGIAVALMLGTSGLLGVPVDMPLLGLAFFGTSLVYWADRTLGTSPEDRINRPRRLAWVHRHWPWMWVEGGVLGIGVLVGGSFLEVPTLLGAVGLAGIGGLHVLPALVGGPRLKHAGTLKPMVVAAVWALGGVCLPLLEAGATIGIEALALVGYRFLFILPNVLLADWGDRAGDMAVGLRPWTTWGTDRGLRWVATGLLGAAALGVGGALLWGAGGVPLGVDAMGLLLMLGAVWTANPQRPAHRFAMDLIVAWPAVTALVAWGVG